MDLREDVKYYKSLTESLKMELKLSKERTEVQSTIENKYALNQVKLEENLLLSRQENARLKKYKPFSLGVQFGYGMAQGIMLHPYVGFGLGYNFVRFGL